MKKLILTSVTVLFIGIASFAQENGKATNQTTTKSNQAACAKNCSGDKANCMTACNPNMKCCKDQAGCKTSGKKEGEKKDIKASK